MIRTAGLIYVEEQIVRIAQTHRTNIDSIGLQDAPFFLELLNSPTWLRFIGDRHVHCVMEAEAYLRSGLLKNFEEHGYTYYVVRKKDATSIGICGFLRKQHLENPDFGFAYLPQFQGQGYGFEAGRAVLDFGIRRFGFRVLDAVARDDNIASMRLLEKLDFVRVEPATSDIDTLPTVLFQWSASSGTHPT